MEPSDAEVHCALPLFKTFAIDVYLQIKASEIDFSSLSPAEVTVMHDIKTYPPRVKMSVHKIITSGFIIPVKIDGCAEEGQLNTELLFRPGGNLILECVDSELGLF